MEQNTSKGFFGVSTAEVIDLLRPQGNPEGVTKAIFIFVGLLLTPVTLLGTLLFYRRGYTRFMEPNHEYPRLSNLSPIMRVALFIGPIVAWIILYLTAQVMVRLILWVGGNSLQEKPGFVLAYLVANILLTGLVLLWFSKWRGGIYKFMSEVRRYGSARFATLKELLSYRTARGFYIGAGLFYHKAGHILTVAGTRAGKAVNLILYNLLMNLFRGSWVIIDPKGELAAISARIQRFFGRKVFILNPLSLLTLANTGYNPLDILTSGVSLADDVMMVAESLIPANKDEKDPHFSDRSRSFLSTMLMHLVTKARATDRHLGTIWSWLRLDSQQWIELLADMMLNDDPHVGDIVRAGANEIASLMKTSDREFGSIMSTAQTKTDFIKSPRLRESLKGSDDFTSADIASGNVTVYLCLPFEFLQTHSGWSRLVVTSLMRSFIRNGKGKELGVIIDEAASFGYHSEILTAMSAYAGFGVHIWNIFQDLTQIKDVYGDKWQTFIQNSSVRHFFNISDPFSGEFLEKMFGQTSIPTYNEKGEISGATPRPLVTMDEIRRESGESIYTIIDQLPVAQVPKHPYFLTNLDCDPNPYYKPEAPKENDAFAGQRNPVQKEFQYQH